MQFFTVIVPDNTSTNPLIQKPGIAKPEIKAKSEKEAKQIAVKLYGKEVIVFGAYNPEWK